MDSNSESEDQGESQSIPTPPPLPQPPPIYKTPEMKEDFVLIRRQYREYEDRGSEEYESRRTRPSLPQRQICQNPEKKEDFVARRRQIREYEDSESEEFERIITRRPLPEPPQIFQTRQLKEYFVKPENCYSCQEAIARDTLSHYEYERYNSRRVCVRSYCKNCSLKETRRSSDKKLNKLNEGSHLNIRRQIREYEDPEPEDYERRRTRPPLPQRQICQTPEKKEDFVRIRRQYREYEDPESEEYERILTRRPLPEPPQIFQTPQKKEDFVKPENCYSCQRAKARNTLSHYYNERFKCRRVCVRRYCENCSLKQSRRSSDKKLNTFFQRKLSLEETY